MEWEDIYRNNKYIGGQNCIGNFNVWQQFCKLYIFHCRLFFTSPCGFYLVWEQSREGYSRRWNITIELWYSYVFVFVPHSLERKFSVWIEFWFPEWMFCNFVKYYSSWLKRTIFVIYEINWFELNWNLLVFILWWVVHYIINFVSLKFYWSCDKPGKWSWEIYF